MSVELYYAPVIEAETISLDELVERFSAGGLFCHLEPEAEDMLWIVLDDHESNLLASVKGDQFVFATFYMATQDDLSVAEIVDEVMIRAGYSALEQDFPD